MDSWSPFLSPRSKPTSVRISVNSPVPACTPLIPGSLPPSNHCGCCWCHKAQSADAAPLQSKSPVWTPWSRWGLHSCGSPRSGPPAGHTEGKTKRLHSEYDTVGKQMSLELLRVVLLCSVLQTDGVQAGASPHSFITDALIGWFKFVWISSREIQPADPAGFPPGFPQDLLSV